MKPPARPMISAVLALALLGAPASALACCDGFWSCAAAIASGGLTCAIEALLNSVKQMKKDVDNLRAKIDSDLKQISDATRGGVRDAGDGLKQAATDARLKYAQAVADAQRIRKEEDAKHAMVRAVNVPAGALGAAGATTGGSVARAPTPKSGKQTIAGAPSLPPPAGGGTTPGGVARFDAPCDDATALSSLRRASEQLLKEQKIAETQVQSAHEKADAANVQADSAADVAKKVAADALVAPLLDLAGMLDDLIRHPDHLLNPAAIVEAAVRRVTDAIGTEFDRMTAAIVAEANKSLEQSRLRAQQAEKMAAAAAKVATVMGELQRSQTKSNCDRLALLVPAPSTTIAVHLASAQPGVLQTTSRTSSSALSRTAAGRTQAKTLAAGASSALSARLRDVLSKQQAAFKPTPVPGADASFRSYADAMFRGLSKSQIAARKNELIAEARRRYANDPVMLQKMIALIGGDADLRVRVGSPPPH